MDAIPCHRSCGRDAVPKDNLSLAICPACQSEIDIGRVVQRQGILIDLPDEIRRYDRSGKVRVAYYGYKGRPTHIDPNDAPEVTWEQFKEYLLFERDFNSHWSIMVWKKPGVRSDGRVELACETSYCGEASRVQVRVSMER